MITHEYIERLNAMIERTRAARLSAPVSDSEIADAADRLAESQYSHSDGAHT